MGSISVDDKRRPATFFGENEPSGTMSMDVEAVEDREVVLLRAFVGESGSARRDLGETFLVKMG